MEYKLKGKRINAFERPGKEQASTDFFTTSDCNKIRFPGGVFCLTGIFSMGTKSEIADEIKKRGGYVIGSSQFEKLSREIDFLVVGKTANALWANGDYGRKIEFATQCWHTHIVGEEVLETALKEVLIQGQGEFRTPVFPRNNRLLLGMEWRILGRFQKGQKADFEEQVRMYGGSLGGRDWKETGYLVIGEEPSKAKMASVEELERRGRKFVKMGEKDFADFLKTLYI